MWRNASDAEKAPYVEQELKERAAYKEDIQKFREKQAAIEAATTRSTHQSAVQGLQTRHQSEPKTLPERPYRGFDRVSQSSHSNLCFDNFTKDPLMGDLTIKTSAFRPHPSQQYHQPTFHHAEYYYPDTYPNGTWSALSMDDNDPLPAITQRGQSPYLTTTSVNNDDFIPSNAFYSSRGVGHFGDTYDAPRFPRYP